MVGEIHNGSKNRDDVNINYSKINLIQNLLPNRLLYSLVEIRVLINIIFTVPS